MDGSQKQYGSGLIKSGRAAARCAILYETEVKTPLWFSVLFLVVSPHLCAERHDPPKEAPTAQIAKILRQAKLVGVFCGDDVDPQTCKTFAIALRMALKDQHVDVTLSYQPENLVQSFYVPPMPLPFTDVTLRLIEATGGPNGKSQVNLGGFCFNSHSQDESGFQLPRWSQTEGDKATAAKKLAAEFSDYWLETVKGESSHKP